MKKKKLSKKSLWPLDHHFLTTGEAASHCQVTAAALRRWIKEAHLRAFKTPGGHRRIELLEFQRFLQEHGIPAYAAQSQEVRILVVDDNPLVVETFLDFLSSDPRGFKLETATDGYEALIKVGSFKPSLLILDVVMPKLDGIEVCRRLKANRETLDMKILGVTAYPDKIPEILEAGADATLTKPFELRLLKQELDRLLADVEA